MAAELGLHYTLHYTSPAVCAAQLNSGEADLGLIPIAAFTEKMAVVPGCTIASLHEVRSIVLLVRNPRGLSRDEALRSVRTLAADSASRSSTAYAAVLFQQLTGAQPAVQQHVADPTDMLATCDAALLIGDPALLAREHAAEIETQVAVPLLWLDVAALWREVTGLPWVAAVWAARPEALEDAGISAGQVIEDLAKSRDAGLAHIEELVQEWTPRIAVPPAVIRTYLTQNIHYDLDPDCLRAVHEFRRLAANAAVLPPLTALRLL